jgi:hypothetical protein
MSIRFINDHRDWRISLDKLLELKNASVLDEHQRYLSGILRHGGDWRIKERALEYAADIQKPTDDLLEDICAVLTNRNTSINLRILAADALCVLVPRKIRRTMAYPVFRGTSVLRVMKDMLKAPEAPALREAITNALKVMKQE